MVCLVYENTLTRVLYFMARRRRRRVKVSVRFMVSFSHSQVQKSADPHFNRSRQFTIRDGVV